MANRPQRGLAVHPIRSTVSNKTGSGTGAARAETNTAGLGGLAGGIPSYSRSTGVTRHDVDLRMG